MEEDMRQDPLVLDPTARRRAEEEKLLHMADGPVLVDILGELAWAIGEPDLLAGLLTDPRVSKDPRQHWPRFIAGEIVGKWLAGLFGRFPGLRLAVPAADLEPVPSILGNGHVALPVRLQPE
jgi:hypothetical protein